MGDEHLLHRRPPDDLPRSPTGRIPKWVIEEAQVEGVPVRRAPELPGFPLSPGATGTSSRRGTRSWRSRSSGRGRRGSAWLSRLPMIVIVAVAVALTAALASRTGGHGGLAWSGRPPVTESVIANAPAPGREAADHALGEPEPLTGTSLSYRFSATQSDGKSPVAYDPCRPVHYVVRPDGAPAGARELISEAVRRVSRATGLQFRDDGVTTEAPSRQRESYQPARYPERWAPVLIAWVTPTENPDFASDVAGEAGSARVTFPGQPTVYVTGQVELDAVKLSSMVTRPGGRVLVRSVIEHELGHLVGLGHVDDATQLMFPETGNVTDYAAGDLTGLAALGRGACVPAV